MTKKRPPETGGLSRTLPPAPRQPGPASPRATMRAEAPNPPDLSGSVTVPLADLGVEAHEPEQHSVVTRYMKGECFAEALQAMRHGDRVTRPGWNEPTKFLTFANNVIYCTRDGHKTVWSPRQVDIVAMDWKLA